MLKRNRTHLASFTTFQKKGDDVGYWFLKKCFFLKVRGEFSGFPARLQDTTRQPADRLQSPRPPIQIVRMWGKRCDLKTINWKYNNICIAVGGSCNTHKGNNGILKLLLTDYVFYISLRSLFSFLNRMQNSSNSNSRVTTIESVLFYSIHKSIFLSKETQRGTSTDFFFFLMTW